MRGRPEYDRKLIGRNLKRLRDIIGGQEAEQAVFPAAYQLPDECLTDTVGRHKRRFLRILRSI